MHSATDGAAFYSSTSRQTQRQSVWQSVWTMYHQMARCRNRAPWSSCPLAWIKWTQRPSPTWLGQLLGSEGFERKCSWEQNSLWLCGDAPWKSFCSCVACVLHPESEVKAGSWQDLRLASPLWWEKERKGTCTSGSPRTAPQKEDVSVNLCLVWTGQNHTYYLIFQHSSSSLQVWFTCKVSLKTSQNNIVR